MTPVAVDREIHITARLAIPATSLRFEFARSSGPGGQNVNKLNTKVTLRFAIAGCAALTDSQKRRVREKLATRITRDDELTVTASTHRTQAANRNAAVERFVELVAGALRPVRVRRATKIPAGSKRRRLSDKLRRGETKRGRGNLRETE